jgi:transcriptional regulator with XRE-family HTH domain
MSEQRAMLVQGIRAALARLPGTKNDKCARLGVSVPTLDRWRSGAGEPSEQNLARLARLAGVEQEWIRNGGQDEAA